MELLGHMMEQLELEDFHMCLELEQLEHHRTQQLEQELDNLQPQLLELHKIQLLELHKTQQLEQELDNSQPQQLELHSSQYHWTLHCRVGIEMETQNQSLAESSKLITRPITKKKISIYSPESNVPLPK